MPANDPPPVPAKQRFSAYYADRPPWDIGRPQSAFVAAADAIRGRVLDLGCGTGDLAIWLAEQGRIVTGVDFLAAPLAQARAKAVFAALTTGTKALPVARVQLGKSVQADDKTDEKGVTLALGLRAGQGAAGTAGAAEGSPAVAASAAQGR